MDEHQPTPGRQGWRASHLKLLLSMAGGQRRAEPRGSPFADLARRASDRPAGAPQARQVQGTRLLQAQASERLGHALRALRLRFLARRAALQGLPFADPARRAPPPGERRVDALRVLPSPIQAQERPGKRPMALQAERRRSGPDRVRAWAPVASRTGLWQARPGQRRASHSRRMQVRAGPMLVAQPPERLAGVVVHPLCSSRRARPQQPQPPQPSRQPSRARAEC